MKKDEKKIEELYNALKNAAYVFCFNAAGDEDYQSNGPCPYALTDDDGIPECTMKQDSEHYFYCYGRQFIEVLKKYKKQGNE